MIFKGVFDRLELFDDCVAIRRTPIAGFFLHGIKGEKRIPYSAITSIQFKRSGVLSGYMQFSIPGGVESTKGLWDAQTDENTVVFTDNEGFEKARDLIEARMRQARSPVVTVSPGGGASAADQLEKLASLLERGLLTQHEFDTQKDRLLGNAKVATATEEPVTRAALPEVEDNPGLMKMQRAMDRAISAFPQQQADASVIPFRSASTFGRRRA